MKIIFAVALGIFFLAPLCVFAEQGLDTPTSFEEIKTTGKTALKMIPDALKRAGEEGWAVIKWLWGYIEEFLAKYIEPWVFRAVDWLKGLFGKEVEERKPEVKEEFKRETENIKQKFPTRETLWERFKSLFY